MIWDVAVLGGGVSGAKTSQVLARKGLKVILIDPGLKKVCAGILTADYLRRYPVDDIYIERRLRGIKLFFQELAATLEYSKETEYSIDRAAFDRFNLSKALEAGAQYLRGRAISIREDEEKVRIKTDSGEIIAGYAVNAMGAAAYRGKVTYCVQQRIAAVPGDFFEMHLHKGGYSWVSPKRDYVLVGTGSKYGYPVARGERGKIPLGPFGKTFSSRTLVVGDAAGFSTPLEGEGIYYAARSAELAANAIMEEDLPSYEKKWKKEFRFGIFSFAARLIENEKSLEALVREASRNRSFQKFLEHVLTRRAKNLDYIRAAPSLFRLIAGMI